MQTTVHDHTGKIRYYHDAPIVHGTISGRYYWRCDCLECRHAALLYRRKQRDDKKQREADLAEALLSA